MAYTYAGRDEKGRIVFYTTDPADEKILKEKYGKNIVVILSPELYAQYAVAPPPPKPIPTPPRPPKKPSPIPPTKITITPTVPVPAPVVKKELPVRKILLFAGLGLAGILTIYFLFRKRK